MYNLPDEIVDLIYQHRAALTIRDYWTVFKYRKMVKWSKWNEAKLRLQGMGCTHYPLEYEICRKIYTLDFLTADLEEMNFLLDEIYLQDFYLQEFS